MQRTTTQRLIQDPEIYLIAQQNEFPKLDFNNKLTKEFVRVPVLGILNWQQGLVKIIGKILHTQKE